MKKNILLFAALLLGITAMQAKPVDHAKAQRLGQNYIEKKLNSAIQLDLAYTFRAENGTATAYVFNFGNGFVVVSADDSYHPILGYSENGNFSYDNAPDGLLFMLGEVNREIAKCITENIVQSSDIVCQWKNLEAYGVLNPEKNIPLVGPLVQTKWDQGAPYNMYVPNGYPTGCVATAMAQLMKYWEWPIQGTGEHSYVWHGQTLSANFGETTYDWANMLNVYSTGTISPENKEAVAVLMSHCGISVDMMYASDGSGAFSTDVPGAINSYFSYSDHATHIGKSASYDDWVALLKTNLDQHIPLYYSGQGDDGGHAFICHGYDNDGLFYFNWGWGGNSDGWFLIDGDKFEFNSSQAIVYDFVPDYVYNGMPKVVEDLTVTIDSDVSRVGHLSWTNPTETMLGEALTSIDKVIVKRNGAIVREITDVAPGQAMTCDDEVPYFDQFEYTVLVVVGDNYGRTTSTRAVFGPYCEWTVLMTSSGFQGWDGGGITVQNAAGSYIDFLTFTPGTPMQRFQMALGNNNLYWVEPNSNISNISFKVKDTENEIVYQYEGPSSELEAGLLRTLNNSCGNENTCEAPYNLKATLDPDNDLNVILTWESDHEPEFGYCIYRDGFLFNMAHETRYVDEYTNLGGHCYYITALCTGGETANSNEYCITSGTGCDEPFDLYFEYLPNKKVQLFWSEPEGTWPTGYIVYRKTDDMTSYREIKRTRQNNVKDTSCTQGTAYQYAVVSYYDTIDCTSTYAKGLFDPSKYYVRVEWDYTPVLLAELAGNEDTISVSLRWSPAFLATSYTIMRDGEILGEVTDLTFTDDNVEAEKTYCYTIIAHGEDYEESSNEVCVTTPEGPEPPEPPVLPCNAPTNLRREEPFGMAHIAWNVPEERDPDSYTVVIVNNLTNETIEVTGISDLFYEEEIIVEEMDKSYKVKAVYEECESEFALTESGDDFVNINNLSVTENGMNVTLYPNPTTGQLTIEMEGLTMVEVYNFVGQCLLRQAASEGTTIVDMSGLQDGVYMVKVSANSGSVMQKVVKM